jgi:acetate kinase
MDDVILVLNSGSSSVKFSVFGVHADRLELKLHGEIGSLYASPHFTAKDAAGSAMPTPGWPEGAGLDHEEAISQLRVFLSSHLNNSRLIAVGHRVVHGGREFSHPILVTPKVFAELEGLAPHNLLGMRIVSQRWPELPQVACFDTAFHYGQQQIAQEFALPRAITKRGVRRYGFHGLSYEYIAGMLPQLDAKAAAGRTVVAHLGNGASMCALRAGV